MDALNEKIGQLYQLLAEIGKEAKENGVRVEVEAVVGVPKLVRGYGDNVPRAEETKAKVVLTKENEASQ